MRSFGGLMVLLDSHTHIYLPEFDTDRAAMIDRALAQGVEKLLLPAIDSETHIVAAGAGLVLERHVTLGQVVQSAEPLCILADLSTVTGYQPAEEPDHGALACTV